VEKRGGFKYKEDNLGNEEKTKLFTINALKKGKDLSAGKKNGSPEKKNGVRGRDGKKYKV